MSIMLYNILYSIWELFKQNYEVINAIVLFLTLCVILWYTIETMKLRKSNESTLEVINENLKLEKQKNEPNVIAYFDNGSNFYSIVLVLSNEGGSTAKNVKITFKPELDFGDTKFIEYFKRNAISNNGIDIQSKSKYVLRIGHTPTASPLYKENKIPTSYKAFISFEDLRIKNKIEKKEFDLTIDQFFYRIDPDGKTKVEQELETINRNLSEISNSLKGCTNDELDA